MSSEAILFVIKSDNPQDTNTITDPEKIIPVKSTIKGVAPEFKRTLDPYSIDVFQLQVGK